ncbi:MAG TPA: M48 family metalloprotease [Symbiobacteriaceae bacterium]|nr:M48 family metalloprotease [Symbiobacteriaceae bacterium]
MSRFWKTVLLLLAIPVISFAVGFMVQSKFDAALYKALAAGGELDANRSAELRAKVNLGIVCGLPNRPAELSEACTAYKVSGLMQSVALWTGAGSLLLVIAIRLAGRRARANRQLLWQVFRPGLYVTMGALMVLLAADGALAVGALYYGGAVLMEVVFPKIILIVAFGAVVGLYMTGKGVLRTFERPVVHTLARSVSPERHGRIWAYVSEVAGRMGVAPPTRIIAGLEPNFFVTEADVHTLDGKHQGRTLYLSLPLSRILTVRELGAIIGHELGHFRGEDTRFSQRFYPIYHGATEALRGLAENMNHFAKTVALWPAAALLALFLESFAEAESHLSRQRELVADQAGAEAAGVAAIAGALVKIHAFSDQWQVVWERMRQALGQREPLPNASLAFSACTQEADGEKLLEGLDQQRVAHPTDSHPPLGARLEALGLSLRDVADQALVASPEAPASDLFGDVEALEETLTADLNRLMREHGLVPVS